jgi:hypothetical protein
VIAGLLLLARPRIVLAVVLRASVVSAALVRPSSLAVLARGLLLLLLTGLAALIRILVLAHRKVPSVEALVRNATGILRSVASTRCRRTIAVRACAVIPRADAAAAQFFPHAQPSAKAAARSG